MRGVSIYWQNICAAAAARCGGYAKLVKQRSHVVRTPGGKVRMRIARDPETGKPHVFRVMRIDHDRA